MIEKFCFKILIQFSADIDIISFFYNIQINVYLIITL